MKGIMKLGIPFKYLVNPIFSQRLLRLFNKLVKLFQSFLGDLFGDEAQCISFQDGPESKEFFHFFLRIPGGDKTSLLARGDETLGLQFMEGFSDGSSTDLQLCCQMLLGQSLSRVEISGKNRRFEMVVNLFSDGQDLLRGTISKLRVTQFCIQF